ncbi:MAG: methyltransferase domain-containing protein [Verrucomicrobia bacterium]|nr:methyltransferase domain-containing protein [Verrucomicrobiota bacterium]
MSLCYRSGTDDDIMELWTTGNAAKLYCLDAIAGIIQQRGPALSILDLGCGDALNFVKLLRAHPQLHYAGLEPNPASCERARKNLAGINTDIRHAPAYRAREIFGRPFDIVVSFSVLEHVYRRLDYLRAAKACLAPGGRVFINYDAGHFLAMPGETVRARLRQRLISRLGCLLAPLGVERFYETFVREGDFQRWLREAGLAVVEAKSFNTHSLKQLYKQVPDAQRPGYMQRWLEFELELNRLAPAYADTMATSFGTRNFILTHAG